MFPNDFRQRPQGIVGLSGGGECGGYIGFQNDHRTPSGVPRRVRIPPGFTEVILRENLISLYQLSGLGLPRNFFIVSPLPTGSPPRTRLRPFERFNNRLGILPDDSKIRAHGSIGNGPALLPLLQCSEAEAELGGELDLGEAEFLPQFLDVFGFNDMDGGSTEPNLAPVVGNTFLEALNKLGHPGKLFSKSWTRCGIAFF
jgi:hypothetical protein